MNHDLFKRIIAVCLLILVGLLSCLVGAKHLSAPELYAGQIASLDEKAETVLTLTASSTLASVGISAIPGDTATPIANKLADIVYSAKWYTPLREALCAFVDVTQQYVTGEIKMKLYKGNIIFKGMTSPYSIYSESIASFTTGSEYNHHDAEGFITLYGLPIKVRALAMARALKNSKEA